MTSNRPVAAAALALGLVAIVAVVVLAIAARDPADNAPPPARTAATPEREPIQAGADDITPVAVGRPVQARTTDLTIDLAAMANPEPIRLSRVCPAVAHHSSPRELLQFLIDADAAIFVLDPAIAQLALLADGALRGEVEPLRVLVASGAAADAVRAAPALAPYEGFGGSVFAYQFKLLRGLALVTHNAQSRLISAFSGANAPGDVGKIEAPTLAMTAIVGLLDDLDYSVEFRDSVTPQIRPAADLGTLTC